MQFAVSRLLSTTPGPQLRLAVAVALLLAIAGCGADPPEPEQPRDPTWTAGFEGRTLREWSYWDRDDGGTFYATAAAAEGLAAHEGTAVGHFEVSPGDRAEGSEHSKVYKTWALAPPESGWLDDADRPLQRLPGGTPDGVYSAWFFIPPDYDNPTDSWANVFQFKESYIDSDGEWQQDPQWWLDLSPAHSWEPSELPAELAEGDAVLAVNSWDEHIPWDPQPVAAPVGRWFQITADVRSGEHIDWYLDGEAFDRSPDAAYPVGLSKPRPTGWTFGVGHYGGVGRLWVDSVSFTSWSEPAGVG